jgi:hypothetical protein
VSGDIADDNSHPAVPEREQIVEVAAGARAVRGPVSRRGADGTETVGKDGEQRALEKADVLE